MKNFTYLLSISLIAGSILTGCGGNADDPVASPTPTPIASSTPSTTPSSTPSTTPSSTPSTTPSGTPSTTPSSTAIGGECPGFLPC